MDESDGEEGRCAVGVRGVGVVLEDAASRLMLPLLGAPRRRERAGIGGAGTRPPVALSGRGDASSTVDMVLK